MKPLLFVIKLLIGLLFLLLTTALFSGFNTIPYTIKTETRNTIITPSDEPIPIFIVNHGWHTGVIIPTQIMAVELPALAKRFESYQYLEIGWGDTGFYQSNIITTRLLVRALFAPTQSVVHVVGFNQHPSYYFNRSQIKELEIHRNNVPRLVQFLQYSFAYSDEQLMPLERGLYGDSQFYRGAGHYYLWNTCNTWTAKAIASSGIGINPAFKLTAGSVMQAIAHYDDSVF